MVWIYVVVGLLVAALLIPNGLYAIRQFLARRDLVWLAVYLILLIFLGYLFLHVTTRVLEINKSLQETFSEIK